MALAIVRIALILLLCMLPFSLARVVLLWSYPQDFNMLSSWQVVQAFVHGTLFDASIVLLFIGFPLLLLLLPFRWARSHWWQGLWVWTCFVVLVLFIFALASDVIYFGIVHRHVGPELTAIGADLDLMAAMVVADYGWVLGIYAVAVIALFFAWRALFHHTLALPRSPWRRVLGMVALLLCFVVVVRGGVEGKPIGVVDAFSSGSTGAAYLTLNGPFAMAHSIHGSEPKKRAFVPWQQALETTQTLLIAPHEQAIDPAYPLLRRSNSQGETRPNVVILMLESWDSHHIDVLRSEQGLPPLGATPNFDQLSTEGVLFTHFYATGQRSMDGLAAILAGLPTLPGVPYLGTGMEQSRMAYLGSLAKKQGYQSYFLQSAKRRSFRVDAIAALAGFENYYGAQDIPASGHSERSTERGAWDYDTLQRAHGIFKDSPQPFLGFIFTASTHRPYQLPHERWKKYPSDSAQHRYLNSLYYADWALGEFIDGAKTAGYFDNTIFVITADHVSGYGIQAGNVPSLHHIPLLVIAPGLEPGVDLRSGSQLDLIPSIIDLGAWDVAYASLGRSLFDEHLAQGSGALAVHGETIERIEGEHWVAHNLDQRTGAHGGSEVELEGIERRLLALYQVAATLLYENRVYHAE